MTAISTDTHEAVAVDAIRDSRLDVSDVGTRPGATDVEETTTGPVVAVDLVDGHLHVSKRRGVTIVGLDGGLDDALAATLAPAIEAAIMDAAAVVLDLDRVTLLDRNALSAICAVLDVIPKETDRCVVAGRLSGRLVLDRWDVPSSFAVFGSVPDALQARAFIESGYGEGWTVGT